MELWKPYVIYKDQWQCNSQETDLSDSLYKDMPIISRNERLEVTKIPHHTHKLIVYFALYATALSSDVVNALRNKGNCYFLLLFMDDFIWPKSWDQPYS